MGVMGTWCQICGIPVQQDHYVPMNPGRPYAIYRGVHKDNFAEGKLNPAIPFGPEHAWLKDAVGLRLSPQQDPAIVAGEAHDGRIEVNAKDNLVLDGIEDRAALHRQCYELAGRPSLWAPAGAIDPGVKLCSYQEQLFAFDALIEDGLGWTLVDPSSATEEGRRNRARILAAIDTFY